MNNPFKDLKKITFNNEEAPIGANWQLLARSYASPAKYIPENMTDVDLVSKAMFGVTTILLQDANSGAIRREEIIGSDENQLFEVLEKSEQLGIQYVNFNNKRFAIALVPQDDNLPLR